MLIVKVAILTFQRACNNNTSYCFYMLSTSPELKQKRLRSYVAHEFSNKRTQSLFLIYAFQMSIYLFI